MGKRPGRAQPGLPFAFHLGLMLLHHQECLHQSTCKQVRGGQEGPAAQVELDHSSGQRAGRSRASTCLPQPLILLRAASPGVSQQVPAELSKAGRGGWAEEKGSEPASFQVGAGRGELAAVPDLQFC